MKRSGIMKWVLLLQSIKQCSWKYSISQLQIGSLWPVNQFTDIARIQTTLSYNIACSLVSIDHSVFKFSGVNQYTQTNDSQYYTLRFVLNDYKFIYLFWLCTSMKLITSMWNITNYSVNKADCTQRRVQPGQCYFTVQITGINFECGL